MRASGRSAGLCFFAVAEVPGGDRRSFHHPATEMPAKSIFLSKTFWVQVLALVSLALPAVRSWLEENPVEFVAVLAALNVVVRFVTSGRISIFADGGGGGASVLLAAGLWCLACPGCGVPLSVGYETPEGVVRYSSKGGLSVDWRAAK